MFKSTILSIFSLLTASTCSEKKQLIKDCPDEKIVNKMPSAGNSSTPKEYYIYKGERREISEFDSTWVSKNCQVKTTEVF
ncbi:hypothetical protein [Flavobacterium sp. H122]|uniref:hypothetical protein n=1 Tax=Flavobacterium sp. H122 TaxID=2529860 RepID=UPI0010AAB582|nr:hypothetical protein [Flavobacterium sp. H122]